jgi:hypothetical protein
MAFRELSPRYGDSPGSGLKDPKSLTPEKMKKITLIGLTLDDYDVKNQLFRKESVNTQGPFFTGLPCRASDILSVQIQKRLRESTLGEKR